MLSNNTHHPNRDRLKDAVYRGLSGALAVILAGQMLFYNNASSAIASEVQDVVDAVAPIVQVDNAAGGSDVENGVSSVDTTDEAEPAAEAESTPDAVEEKTVEPVDWTSHTDSLKLWSRGLTIDVEALAEAVDALDSEEPTLPASIPAKLDLSFSLDATAEAEADREALLAGDTFTVALPDGFELADVTATIDVYAADANGDATDTKLGTAAWKDGKLEVTLDAAAEKASVSGVAELCVTFGSDLVADDATAVDWTLQDVAGRTSTLDVPAYDALLAELGYTGEEPEAEPADNNTAGDESGDDDPIEVGNKAIEFAGSASFTIVWADHYNADSKRPAVKDASSGLTLQFRDKASDATEWSDWSDFDSTSDIVKQGLGIDDTQAEKIGIELPEDTTGDYTYVSGGDETLPSKVQMTKTDGSQTYYDVEWRIVRGDGETFAPDGYTQLQAGDYDGAYDQYTGETRECYQLLEDVNFKLLFRDGTERTASFDDLDDWFNKFGSKVTITVEKEGNAFKTYQGEDLLNYLKSVNAKLSSSEDSGLITYKDVAYLPGNDSLEYKVQHDEGEISHHTDGTCDYYQVAYDNSSVANHGSDISAAYNGGTVYLTRTGTTTFDADKVWLDDGDTSGRGATTYSLWRYSANGGTPTTAAQVADASGKYVEFTVDAATNQALGEDEALDLSQYMSDLQGKLSKYDPDGYPYIYFLREDAVDGYLRVAGDVDENGTITYDPAVYYGEEVDDYSWEEKVLQRDGADVTASSDSICVYNGGTISNVRTDTVKASTSKTWEAGAFQDQLKDVSVTMTLKRRIASDNNSSWQAVEGQSVTLSGWTAGAFTQTAEGNVAKYDMLGREYEYRWFETDVTSTDSNKIEKVTTDDDGNVTSCTMNLNDESGNKETVLFVSSYDSEAQTVTNRYTGQTVARVRKSWNVQGTPEGATEANPYGATKGTDGKLHFTITYEEDGEEKTTDVIFPENLTFSLYQDKTEYASDLVMDGVVDAAWTEVTATDGTKIKYRESAAWQLDFEGLPKYDASGSKYAYQCFEDTPDGFSSGSSFASAGKGGTITTSDGQTVDEVNLTSSSNSPYPGEGTTIRLTKNWVDDGNNTGRNPVTINVIAMSDVTNKAGKKLFSKGDIIRTVTLNEANGWYVETGVAASGGKYVKADSTEVPTSGFTYTVEEVGNDYYDVVDYDNAPDDVKLSPWAGEKRLVSKTSISGSTYAYEISYETAQRTVGNRTYSVIQTTNRRVGLVNVELSKTWVDQGADTTERPDAYYRVESENGEKVFKSDDTGYYVQLSGDSQKYYLYTDAAHTQHLTDAKLEGDGAAIAISVDKTVASGTKTTCNIYGLPKYGIDGAAFTYLVSEGMAANDDGYASATITNETIFDSAYQHSDVKRAEFSNYRSGSKDVTFHTRWYDQYVKEDLSQRPDVYITLYRAVVGTDGKTVISETPVTGYESYKWQGYGETGYDARYAQYATIKDLPKYDSNGAEYVYYAKMTTAVSDSTYKALDYQDTAYATNPNTDPDDQYSGDAKNASTRWNSVDGEVNNAAASGTVSGATVLREEGTFVYSLANTVKIQGTKVWTNVPKDFKGNLPAISLFLQRSYVDDGDTKWSGLQMTKSSGDGLTGKGYDVTSDFTSEQADGKTVVAYLTIDSMKATGASTLTTTFSFNYYGKNNADGSSASDAFALPLYDSAGKRYSYNTREVIDGLIQDANGNPAGGISLDELITQQAEAKSDYTIYTPTVTSTGNGRTFRINNAYVEEEQAGQITVKKNFDGPEEGDIYPAKVTFTLYRRVADGEWTKLDTRVLDSSAFDPSNQTGSVTFSDLAYFDPSGTEYEYKVVEDKINGYATYAEAGDKTAPSTQSNEVTGLKPRSASEDEAAATADATFLNKYATETVALCGSKTWNDSSNMFNTREDIFGCLVLTRHSVANPDKVETVTMQNTDSAAANYLAWTSTTGSDAYSSFTISNVDEWSTDGTAWVYELSEDSSKIGEDSHLGQYTFDTGSITANASEESAAFDRAFVNTLKTSLTVTKAYEGDGGNANRQRPNITVSLHVSKRAVSGGDWSDWNDPKNLLGLDANSYAPSGKSTAFDQDIASWVGTDTRSYTWTELPRYYRDSDGTVYELRYRAFESKLDYGFSGLGGQQAVCYTSVDSDGNYQGNTGYYTPTQVTTTDGDATTTTITNTMGDTTSLTITKTWDDDSNKWDRRASVTYALQRRIDDFHWQYVAKDNVSVDSNNPLVQDSAGIYRFNDSIVTYTLSASDNPSEDGNTWSLKIENLPLYDPETLQDPSSKFSYEYRVVELVTPGYSVTNENADVIQYTGNSEQLVSLEKVTDGNWAFTNKLDTVTYTGQKKWTRYGVALPSAIDLTVTQNGTDITDKVDIQWSNKDTDTWTYTILGLPKYYYYESNFSYFATEAVGAVDGFVTTNPTENASYVGNLISNNDITNTATLLTFDKLDDKEGTGAAGGTLNDVEFTVKDSDGNTVAVWGRDANGTVSVTNTSGCVSYTDPETSVVYIAGLKAGTYTVSETKTPANHLKYDDFHVTISKTGEITVAEAGPEVLGDNNNVVTVRDTVLRGKFGLNKYYMHSTSKVALSGMTFDLYKQVGDSADSTNDVRIATGLTTDEKGAWSSKGSTVEYTDEGKAVLGKYYETAADGLPLGNYYFKERGSSNLVKDPSYAEGDGIYSFSVTENDDNIEQPKAVTVSASNTEFNATAELTKLDGTENSGVNDAVFELKYGEGDDAVTVSSTLKSGYVYSLDATGTKVENTKTSTTDGLLRIEGLKKGTYTLTEKSNTGYKVVDTVMTLTVTDGDQGQTLSFDGGSTLTNERLTGTVTMTKTKTDKTTPIADAVFKLQVKGSDGTWSDVEGKTNLTTDADGKITVEGLAWGTYKFVETTSAEGYYGSVESKQLVVNRSTFDPKNANPGTVDAGVLTNNATTLTVVKKSTDSATTKGLAGATFTLIGRFAGEAVENTKTMTTGTDGKVSLDPATLVVGETYLLQETVAPAGYKLNGNVYKFQVEKSGAIAFVDSAVSGATVSGAVVTVTDEPFSFSFAKRDSDDSSVAVAASYQIKPVGQTTFVDGTADAKTWSTDASGNFTVTAELVANGTYELTEVSAQGYQVSASKLTFKVDSEGKLSAEGVAPEDMTIGVDGVSVSLTDPKIVISASKSAEGFDASRMAGAVFTITPASGSAFVDKSASKTLTIGENGVSDELSAQLIAGNSYVVTETSAPSGFTKLSSSMTFKVENNGKLTKTSTEGDDGWGISEDGTQIAAVDTPTALSVVKVAAGEGGAELAGAEFELSGTFVGGATSPVKLTTGEDGTANVAAGILLADGKTTYAVKETKAPTGYELDGTETTFTVGTDGKVTVKSGKMSVSDDGLALTATDDPTTVTIEKTDLAGNKLSGAKITLTDTTDKAAEPIVVDLGESGSATSTAQLVGGHKYAITESETPAGFLPLSDEVTLAVATDGTLTLEGTSDFVSLSDGKLTIKDEPTELVVTKYSADGYPDTKTALSGAVFSVKPTGDAKFADGTTDAKIFDATDNYGRTSLVGQLVVGGTYELSEVTAPAGYKLVSGSMTFTVNADGSFTVADGSAAAYTVDGETVKVFAGGVLDDPTTMSVQKVDAANAGTKLSGAEFKLTGSFADNTSEKTLITAGEMGLATLDKAVLIADGKTVYTLTETKAPAGYELDATPTTFTVGTDGKISVKSGNMTATGDDLTTVSAKDTAIQIFLNKVSASGAALSGAKFELVPTGESAFSDGTTTAREVSVSDTGATISGLVAGGTYKLTETTAPEGYKLMANALEFEVATDGTVSATTPDGWTIAADGVNVTASDEAMELTIGKSAADGTPAALSDVAAMTGATFNVTGVFANMASETTKTVTIGDKGTGSLESAQLVAGRTYKISEASAPAGFKKLIAELTVKVGADGTLSVEGTAPEGWTVSGADAKVGAVDEAIAITLEKAEDGDIEGEAPVLLADAEFTLSGEFADGKGGTESKTVNLTTSAYGSVELEGLVAYKSYTLIETKAPAGYELDSTPTTFTVDASGEVTVTEGNVEESEDRLTITAYDDPTQLQISKSAADDEDASMAGAEFTVTGVFAGSADTRSKTLTIGEDNVSELLERGLVAGNEYTITETKPADGYMVLVGTLKVKVNSDGSLEVTQSADGFTVSVDEDGVAIVSAVDDPISFGLIKSGTDGVSGAAMEGAVFRVSGDKFAGDDAGKDCVYATTDEDGVLQLDGVLVAGGTYIVDEIVAPAGYELIDGKLTFSLTADGRDIENVNFDGEYDDMKISVVADGDGAPLLRAEAFDNPAEVVFEKVDAEGNGLPGAELFIESVDDGEDFSLTVTTDENGRAELSAALVAGRTYRVSETKAPLGYKLAEGSFTFVVDEDGNVSADGAAEQSDAYQLLVDEQGVRVSDELIEATLTKVDADDASKVLSGAEFTLSGTFADGTGAATAGTTTLVSADGAVALEGLVAGETYTLTETSAPEGYQTIEGTMSFTVSADGSLEVLEGGFSNGTLSLAADDQTALLVGDKVIVPEADEKSGSEGSSPYTGDPGSLGSCLVGTLGLASFALGTRRRRKERQQRR